jgi:hypothetical protein
VIGVAAERGDPQRPMRRLRARLASSAELRQVEIRDADLAERRFEGL